MKADLKGIDQHFDSLPDEVKSKDLFKFASDLPEEACPLIVQLWDKHLPTWRQKKAEHKPLPPDMQKAVMDMINRAQQESTPINPKQYPSIEDISYVHVQPANPSRKGTCYPCPQRRRTLITTMGCDSTASVLKRCDASASALPGRKQLFSSSRRHRRRNSVLGRRAR